MSDFGGEGASDGASQDRELIEWVNLFALGRLVEGEWCEYGKVGEGALKVGHAQFIDTGPAPKQEHLRWR